MPAKVFSATHIGLECHLVEVEVEIVNGISSFEIVGLPDTAIQEAKQRIYAAVKNCGIEYPRQRKIINLAPAELPKHGPSFDLPMAVGLLIASKQLDQNFFRDAIIIGELGLDGKLRRVKGALSVTAFSKKSGFRKIILPQENFAEASLVPDIKIFPVDHLNMFFKNGKGLFEKEWNERREQNGSGKQQTEEVEREENISERSFIHIYGHEQAKRALIIAAAGGHHLLLTGPPGSGKTMLGRSFQAILPPLEFEAAIEVTKIHSLAGKLNSKNPLIRSPPVRSLHHTASTVALVGGGNPVKPGEISLAHHGVLFLDELPEFPRASLEALRQPLEDSTITIHRANFSAEFPAKFILLGTMNPCPCGFANDSQKRCMCPGTALLRYRKKLSGPLLDRIDLVIEVPRLPKEKLHFWEQKPISHTEASNLLTIIREKILRARGVQHTRLGRNRLNRDLVPHDIETLTFAPSAQKLLSSAIDSFQLSPRGYFRIIKVARTIADLEASTEISESHIAEALQYRSRTADDRFEPAKPVK